MSLSKWEHVAAVGVLSILFAVPAASQIAGTTSVGQLGVGESVRDIMARERARGPHGPLIEKPIFRAPEIENVPQNPASQALPSWPPPGRPAQAEPLPAVSTSLPAPLAPQTLGTSFTGASFSADSLGITPPDSMGAVGPTQYIVAINERIRSFNKATGVADTVLDTTTDSFFASVAGGSGTSDPRIRYDRLSGRWILVIINTPNNSNSILIAVSDAASAGTITMSTVFTYFSIPVVSTPPTISNKCFGDYPTLGIDANALYIGTNNFCPNTFDSSDGFVVRKSSVLGGGPIVVTVFRGLVPAPGSEGPFTPQGVDNYDPASTEGYFIGRSAAFLGELVLRRVSNPGGSPSTSPNILITVNTTASPISVPALGSVNNLDSLGSRLLAAHIRNGKLWTAHTIQVDNTGVASSTGGRDGSRWYELQGIISPGTPSVVQSGTVFDSAATNPLFFWMSSILPSGQGHAAIGFSTAGAAARANAGTAGRLVGDAAGTMQAFVNYTASTAAYNNPIVTNPQRWGDYSYTSLDPLDDMTMWTIQEFCDATNSYGVRVVKLIAPPPATPSSAVPAAVEPGNPSITIAITGTAVSGSGFYDPGANLASPALAFNHISGSASGGVTVNSVTFVDPTHVTLNISTVGAPAGTKNITITNPDGQSATGIGILTVGATAARVLSFDASPSGGNVLLQWRTGSEVQTLGFNVYREENDRLIQLNSSLIASSAFSSLPTSGTAVAGQSYNWLDAGSQSSYGVRYWLEEIDISGQSLWHGPVTVAPVILPRSRR